MRGSDVRGSDVRGSDVRGALRGSAKKQRAKKPKVAGYMSSVNNDHVLFKTHKEAYDYWRNQQGQGENNGGIYECDYGKTLEFLK